MQGVKTPCAFNQYGFSNFFKGLKIRTAWRKDFFDTLCGFYIRPKPGSIYPGPRWLRELGTDAPCAPLRGAVGVGAFDTSVRTGGYKIRPYKPALGFPVGAACMAARTGSRLPPGFDGPATPESEALRRPHTPPSAPSDPPLVCSQAAQNAQLRFGSCAFCQGLALPGGQACGPDGASCST